MCPSVTYTSTTEAKVQDSPGPSIKEGERTPHFGEIVRGWGESIWTVKKGSCSEKVLLGWKRGANNDGGGNFKIAEVGKQETPANRD